MGKNVFTNLAESLMTTNGQAFHRTPGNLSQRLIYPAIVREVSNTPLVYNLILFAAVVCVESNAKTIWYHAAGSLYNAVEIFSPVIVPTLLT